MSSRVGELCADILGQLGTLGVSLLRYPAGVQTDYSFAPHSFTRFVFE